MLPSAVLDVMMPKPGITEGVSATFSITGGRAVERIRNGEMVPWAGFIVVEGVDTGDMRRVAEGALSWHEESLPLPLMAQFVNPVGGSGHDGAILAGNITTLTRIDHRVWATGYIDPYAPGGIDLALALDRQTMRGISVDLDAVQLAETRSKLGTLRNIARGRIRGATVCPFQAIVEATIELTTEEEGAMAASAAGTLTARVFTPVDAVESLVASGGSAIPLAPPRSWFAKPANPAELNHPLEISADGRLSGIIASEGTCHIAFAGKCVPPPKSRTNYAAFRCGSVLTAEGDTIRTGPIVMDTVHPDLKRAASDAMAFYAHTGAAVADVVPYDTQFGIYVAGVVRPDASPVQIRNLRASDISPDWRYINGNPRECCALVAVNNGGFKVTQSLAASAGDYVMPGDTAVAVYGAEDEVFALVASGGYRASLAADDHDCGCGCDGAEGGCGDTTELAVEEATVVQLSAKFMAQFGPRQFLTPTMRQFRFNPNQARDDQGQWTSGGFTPAGERIAAPPVKTGEEYYDGERGYRVGADGVPIIHAKTQLRKLEKEAWNYIRWDESDLTDDNVYGPGETYAPTVSKPLWIYIGTDGYGDTKDRTPPPAPPRARQPARRGGAVKRWLQGDPTARVPGGLPRDGRRSDALQKLYADGRGGGGGDTVQFATRKFQVESEDQP